MFTLFIVIRSLRKAKKQIRFTLDQATEIHRNAAAYGWEVGRGALAASEIDSTPGNPFLEV